jgi:hypothetical protein
MGKLPREGSEGYGLRRRLIEVTKYGKELRAEILAWQALIRHLRTVVDIEKDELLTI